MLKRLEIHTDWPDYTTACDQKRRFTTKARKHKNPVLALVDKASKYVKFIFLTFRHIIQNEN